jgi:hypothetical protein
MGEAGMVGMVPLLGWVGVIGATGVVVGQVAAWVMYDTVGTTVVYEVEMVSTETLAHSWTTGADGVLTTGRADEE